MAEMISLRDGGTLAYDEAFFGNEEADALFDRLPAETPWKQEAGRGRRGPPVRCRGTEWAGGVVTTPAPATA